MLRLFSVGSILAGAAGVALGLFARRLPTRGWIAFLLLTLSTITFVNIEPSMESKASTRIPLVFLFMVLAPCAAVYSALVFKRVANKRVAWAALAGGIVIGLLALFYFVGCIYALAETFILG